MTEYRTSQVYEDAFGLVPNFKKWLPCKVYEYHNLVYEELNSPVALQMGVLLPFIASLCGPRTKGHFLTRPSPLNLFWLNVAASGVGKSQTRTRMLTEPLTYLLGKCGAELQDFEVSKFTRAGMYMAYLPMCCIETGYD